MQFIQVLNTKRKNNEDIIRDAEQMSTLEFLIFITLLLTGHAEI